MQSRFLSTTALAAVLVGSAFPAHSQTAAPASPLHTLAITIHSGLGAAFALKDITVVVDSMAPKKMLDAQAKLNASQEMALPLLELPAGAHTLDITLAYEGTGYGVFSYLKGYQFNLRAHHPFAGAAGHITQVRVESFEKGNATTEMKDRPAIKVDAQDRDLAVLARQEQSQKIAEAQRSATQDTGLKTAEEAAAARMKGLEERSQNLQEQIGRTKERVAALQDALLSGNVAAGRANVVFRNEMGASFQLKELHVFLDGAPIREAVDETGDGVAKQERIALFEGNILPGVHTLNVNLVYQGVGYGVFADANNSLFKLRSTHSFTVEQDKSTSLDIVAFEQGTPDTPLKDRPTMRFDAAVKPGAAPTR